MLSEQSFDVGVIGAEVQPYVGVNAGPSLTTRAGVASGAIEPASIGFGVAGECTHEETFSNITASLQASNQNNPD